MKKISLILLASAAAALALVSCSKEMDAPVEDAAVEGVVRTVSFNAESVDAKTAFGTPSGSSVPTLWTANDSKVKVSLNLADPVDATVTPDVGGATAKILAEIVDDASGNYTFFAVSPAKVFDAVDAANGKLTVTIPIQQTAIANSADESAQVLVGNTTTYTDFPSNAPIAFTHLTAYGKLTLTNLDFAAGETINSVSITAGSPWVGKVVLDISDFSVSVTNGSKTLKVLTDTATDIWFACAPVNLGGTEVTILVGTNKGTYIKTVTLPDKKFESGKISSFTIDMTGKTQYSTDAIFVNAGYDITKYTRIPLNMVQYSYYNSQNNSAIQTGTSDTHKKFYATDRLYTRSEIPNGSIIVILDDFLYRPEAWISLSAVKSSNNPAEGSGGRPKNVLSSTDQVVVVDDAWWLRGADSKQFTFRAFQVGLESGAKFSDNPAAEVLAPVSLGIYVPNDQLTPEAILTAAGYDLTNYTKLDLGMTKRAFWNSNTATPSVMSSGTGSNYGCFTSTRALTKEDIPNGSVIVQKNGQQYRPEGWWDDSTKNTGRPGNVTTQLVVVDDAWWGTYNFRAFNVALLGGASTYTASGSGMGTAQIGYMNSDYQLDTIEEGFAIFVPKN